MQLSSVGILTDIFWHEINNHAKDVKLELFIVMPNHIHGILILNKNNGYDRNRNNNNNNNNDDNGIT
jgi:REP-associated tyrosine transposase